MPSVVRWVAEAEIAGAGSSTGFRSGSGAGFARASEKNVRRVGANATSSDGGVAFGAIWAEGSARAIARPESSVALVKEAVVSRFCGSPLTSVTITGNAKLSTGGKLAGAAQVVASFWIPSKNSPPSRRRLRATPENCSRCHFTVRLDPTVIGVRTRIHAPETDVSSRVAGRRCGIPVESCQATSATAHTVFRGSRFSRYMVAVSANQKKS